MCGAKYIGKTNNEAKKRISEHLRELGKKNCRSAVAKHTEENPEHDEYHIRIREKNRSYLQNDIRELMVIREEKPELNRQCDFEVL
jgi:anti-sigma factor RsiW